MGAIERGLKRRKRIIYPGIAGLMAFLYKFFPRLIRKYGEFLSLTTRVLLATQTSHGHRSSHWKIIVSIVEYQATRHQSYGGKKVNNGNYSLLRKKIPASD